MIWPLISGRGSRVERQAYAWLMKMLDDPARHSAGLERWLARDPEHRTVYQRAANAIGRASDTGAMRPHLLAGARRKSVSSPKWGMRAALVTIGVAIAAVVMVNAKLWHSSDRTPQKEPVVAEQFQNDAGDRTIRLSDGSEVTLFGAAKLTADLQPSRRSIALLDGHARFTVAHDPSRPFVVQAGGGSVTAIGTVFEVTVGRKVDVRLIEGKIRVAYAVVGEKLARETVSLQQGQSLSFTAEGGAGSLPKLEVRAASPQGQRLQTFDDTPVAEIIAATNRGSDTQIILSDSSVGARKIFADIDISDPDAVAQKLAKILDLSIARPSAGVIKLEPKGNNAPR
jgi:transmembrane sensor